MPREAGDVHLVDHGRGEGPAQRRVTLPVVDIGVDHHALHGDRIVLPVSARRVARISVGHDDGASVGIEERFGRIETQTALGIERAVGAICINLPGTDAGHKDVPVMVGAMRARIELDHARRVRGGGIIEQQEVHPARLPREHAEVDALGEDGGAEREAPTRCLPALEKLGILRIRALFLQSQRAAPSARCAARRALHRSCALLAPTSWLISSIEPAILSRAAEPCFNLDQAGATFARVRSHIMNSIPGFDLDQSSGPPASLAFET